MFCRELLPNEIVRPPPPATKKLRVEQRVPGHEENSANVVLFVDGEHLPLTLPPRARMFYIFEGHFYLRPATLVGLNDTSAATCWSGRNVASTVVGEAGYGYA